MTILQMSSGNGCYIAWNTLGSKIAGLESLSERPPTVSLFSISTDSWKYPYALRKSMTRPTGLRCPVKYQIKCWLHIPAALQFARNGSLSQDCAYMKREETEKFFFFFFSQSWLNKGTLFLFLFLFIYLFTKKKKRVENVWKEAFNFKSVFTTSAAWIYSLLRPLLLSFWWINMMQYMSCERITILSEILAQGSKQPKLV